VLFVGEVEDENAEEIRIAILETDSLIALMMEAARTSETLVNFYQTTRCYNQEDSNLQILRRFHLCFSKYCAFLSKLFDRS
jgi:hypothetical protein